MHYESRYSIINLRYFYGVAFPMAGTAEDYLRLNLEQIFSLFASRRLPKIWDRPIQGWRVLFFGLPRRTDKALLVRQHQDRVQKGKSDE